MKISSRIQRVTLCLQKVVSIPFEKYTWFDNLNECVAEVKKTVAHHAVENHSYFLNYYSSTAPRELPVTRYSLAEFQYRVQRITPTSNPQVFAQDVDAALRWLVVYQLGWSEQIETERLEAFYLVPEAEIIVSDVSRCYRLTGEEVTINDTNLLRPATKSELIKREVYNYHQQLD